MLYSMDGVVAEIQSSRLLIVTRNAKDLHRQLAKLKENLEIATGAISFAEHLSLGNI
jgi:hypothetical protein